MKLTHSKLAVPAIIALLAVGGSLAGCTPQQTTQASAVVTAICTGAAAGVVAVQADGTILNATSATQAKIAAGAQMIPVNCALAQTAVAAIAAASAASPTALVSVENEYASNLKIEPTLMHKIVKHYTGK